MKPFTEERAFQTRRRFLAALGSDGEKFIGNDEAGKRLKRQMFNGWKH